MPLGIFDSLFPFVFLGCLVIGGGGGFLSTSRRLGELEILLVFLAMDSLSVAWAHMPLGRGVSPNSQDSWCFWVQMPLVPDHGRSPPCLEQALVPFLGDLGSLINPFKIKKKN